MFYITPQSVNPAATKQVFLGVFVLICYCFYRNSYFTDPWMTDAPHNKRLIILNY